MIPYIESVLWIWADWNSRGADALGYPRKTVEARLMAEGCVLIKGTGLRREPTNELAESVEAALVAIAPELRELAKRRYEEREPAPVRNKSTYYYKLNKLHTAVMEWLNDHA